MASNDEYHTTAAALAGMDRSTPQPTSETTWRHSLRIRLLERACQCADSGLDDQACALVAAYKELKDG